MREHTEVYLPPFSLETLLMMSVNYFFQEHIKPQEQIYVRGDDRTKSGKLESYQWSVVNDLADPRKPNAKSAEGTTEGLISHRSPSNAREVG